MLELKYNEMKRKYATFLIILILLIFVGYIIYDASSGKGDSTSRKSVQVEAPVVNDSWVVTGTIDPASGKVKAVGVMDNGNLIIGGDSFIACYGPGPSLLWNIKTNRAVTAICATGDTIYASTENTIGVYGSDGSRITEWGPFEDSTLITSVAANNKYVAYADASNRVVMVYDRKGNLKSMIGRSGEPFIIPSPYFDLAIDGNDNLYITNTGKFRIEKRNISGSLLESFGQAGMGIESFCGCCNPAHMAIIPGGFVTAEKGINRIKIVDSRGRLIESVSSVNGFLPAMPLDLASADGKIIYGANRADSKVYIFEKK